MLRLIAATVIKHTLIHSSFQNCLMFAHNYLLEPALANKIPGRESKVCIWSVQYLAVVAAESAATLGAVGQGARITAGSSFFGTLLKVKQKIFIEIFF